MRGEGEARGKRRGGSVLQSGDVLELAAGLAERWTDRTAERPRRTRPSADPFSLSHRRSRSMPTAKHGGTPATALKVQQQTCLVDTFSFRLPLPAASAFASSHNKKNVDPRLGATDLFALGSTTKFFTAVSILRLVDSGQDLLLPRLYIDHRRRHA